MRQIFARIQEIVFPSSVWNETYADHILLQGERGIESDTRLSKLGDGISKWQELNYEAACDNEIISVLYKNALNEESWKPLEIEETTITPYLQIICKLPIKHIRILVNGSIVQTISIDKTALSTKEPAYNTEHILQCSNSLPTDTECIIEGMVESDNVGIGQIWQPIGKFVFKRYFYIQYGETTPTTLKTYFADEKSMFAYNNVNSTKKFVIKLPNNIPATIKINGMIGGLKMRSVDGYSLFEAYQTQLGTILIEVEWNT